MQHYFLGIPDQPAPSDVLDPAVTAFKTLDQAQQYVADDLGEQGTWQDIHNGQWLFFPTGSTSPTRQIDLYGSGSTAEAAMDAADLKLD